MISKVKSGDQPSKMCVICDILGWIVIGGIWLYGLLCIINVAKGPFGG